MRLVAVAPQLRVSADPAAALLWAPIAASSRVAALAPLASSRQASSPARSAVSILGFWALTTPPHACLKPRARPKPCASPKPHAPPSSPLNQRSPTPLSKLPNVTSMIPAKHKIQHNAHLVSDLTIRKNKSGREPLKAPGPTVLVCARHSAASAAPAGPPLHADGTASATQATRLGQLLVWVSYSIGVTTMRVLST